MTIANLEKLCRLIKNNNDNLPSPPLPTAKLKVFLHRKVSCLRVLFSQLIFPCTNIFLVLRPLPPLPHKFSNGPSLR